jgi:hypothetical protein
VVVGALLPPAADGKVYQVITSGLNAGEQIIIDGVQKVRPGAPVTPLTQAAYDQMIQQQMQK